MLLMSQSEFARKMGVTQQAISKLIKQNKLPVQDKKLIMPDAEKAYHQIKAGIKLTNTHNVEVFSPGELPSSSENATMQDFLNVRVKKEAQLAELNKLRVKKEQGRLIEVEDVINQCNKAMEIVRNELLNLPSRIAMVLEDKTAHEIQLKLEDEINHAMQSLFDLGKQYQLENDN